MKPGDLPPDLFSPWEGAVAFRLFADQTDPTLTVSEQIAARVGDRSLSGAMPPGARIGEQELADEFRVSRGPVREAIRVLERETESPQATTETKISLYSKIAQLWAERKEKTDRAAKFLEDIIG